MRLMEWTWSWESKPLRQPWHSLALAAFSLALLFASASSYVSTAGFISSANRATGVVSRMLRAGDSSYPQVSFVDDLGVQRSFESRWRSSPPRYSEGETVVVLYVRRAPGEARIENFAELWLVTLVTGVLGLALGIAGLLLWVFRHRLFAQYQERRRKAT